MVPLDAETSRITFRQSCLPTPVRRDGPTVGGLFRIAVGAGMDAFSAGLQGELGFGILGGPKRRNNSTNSRTRPQPIKPVPADAELLDAVSSFSALRLARSTVRGPRDSYGSAASPAARAAAQMDETLPPDPLGAGSVSRGGRGTGCALPRIRCRRGSCARFRPGRCGGMI